jgi:hypothetical protein
MRGAPHASGMNRCLLRLSREWNHESQRTLPPSVTGLEFQRPVLLHVSLASIGVHWRLSPSFQRSFRRHGVVFDCAVEALAGGGGFVE